MAQCKIGCISICLRCAINERSRDQRLAACRRSSTPDSLPAETRSGMIGPWRTKLECSMWPAAVVVGPAKINWLLGAFVPTLLLGWMEAIRRCAYAGAA